MGGGDCLHVLFCGVIYLIRAVGVCVAHVSADVADVSADVAHVSADAAHVTIIARIISM